MGIFYMTPLSNWAAFWQQKRGPPVRTTIRGIIDAGNYYTWTSAALDDLLPYHSELSWLPLFTNIFTHISRMGNNWRKSESRMSMTGKKSQQKNHSSRPEGREKEYNSIETYLNRARLPSPIVDSVNLGQNLPYYLSYKTTPQ
jgi:hypothetical protein